jgi:FkbM family methyltransferase
MDDQFSAVFKSILSVRDSLESSISDIKGVLGHGEDVQGDQVEFLIFAARRAPLSSAQLLQDLWVLYELGQKRDGYFVEVGACDGSTLSNTLLLEKVFGWRGALAEPARCWQERLRANRACYVTDRCVFSADGAPIGFNETAMPEYSTIDEFSKSDLHGHIRQAGKRYEVETVSLRGLLRDAGAPTVIDYLSIDTEGSEYEILRHFDFSEYDVKLLSVEHNYTSRRESIHSLMRQNGYRRKFETLSMFDDWYVKADRDGTSLPA